MNERQKVMNETSWAMRKITDLRDMLDDGMPSKERGRIYREIDALQDVIFYNQEYLSSLDCGG
ncbi:MAG: hypothetical protein ACKODS_04640 [Methylophilaceae bacterium]